MCKGFALLIATLLSVADSQPDEYNKAFADYVRRFQKEYDSKHVDNKFDNFKNNYIFISRENQKGSNKYTLGVNEFTDMSPEEFRTTHHGFIKPKQDWRSASNLGTVKYDGRDLADSVDWNAKGAVTPVKNQAQCGSCWSFSTTGALEGAWFVATGKLVSVSEEQLVECSTENSGCKGGLMQKAFEFEEGVDICTEASYPYTSGGGDVGSCRSSGCTVGIPKGGVTGYQNVAPNDMNALMQAVSTQPVSIAVEADQPFWQSYQSGVMTDTCGTKLDHGILCVGYGTDAGTKYWLVKNSWGSTWGIEGFAKLERGIGGGGECGILTSASYPQVKTSSKDGIIV